jgi:hypothetical protein
MDDRTFEIELRKAILFLFGHVFEELRKSYTTESKGALTFLYTNTEYLVYTVLGNDCICFIKNEGTKDFVEKVIDLIIETFNYEKSRSSMDSSVVSQFDIVIF